MIQWILEHLGIVVVIVLFVAQMVRGVMRQRKTGRPEIRRDDGDEERRVREVQEQIRRQIAARRAEGAPADTPPVLSGEAGAGPVPRAETTQMPEPFGGGPLGRMLEELQRKAQQHLPPPAPPPPVAVERRNVAELERQQRLADELKAIEETRVVQRRAAHVASDKQLVARSESSLRVNARERLLDDLGDAESVRRAFVLREVLGTPVGLR
ncbi:MAG: hypothetical protein ACREH8_15330 [Opitutaceae bacterium]